MTFTSLSDLYFVVVAMYSYNILWQIILDTGLIFLPFIMVIIEVLKDGMESSKNMADSGYTMKALEVKIYSMLAALVLFVLPILPFDLDRMAQYTKICEIDGSENIIDDDIGTDRIGSIDNTRLSGPVRLSTNELILEMAGTEIKLPFMLKFVLAFGTGYTIEAVDRLPCSVNIVGMSQELMKTQIKDPDLLVETKEFIRQCYEPARSLAVRNRDMNMPWLEDPDTENQPWPGHGAFMNTAYYGNVGRGFYSRSLIPGFQSAKTNQYISKWVESREAENSGQIECDGTCLHETGGFPSCYEWWAGVGAGYEGVSLSNMDQSLRGRLLANMRRFQGNERITAMLQRVIKRFDPESTAYEQMEMMLKLSYFNAYSINRIKGAETKDYAWESETNGFWGAISRGLGTIGTYGAAIGNFAGASLIQLAAPIVKGMMLAVIIAVLPLACVVSKFGFKFLVPLHFFLFAILFWPFLWELTMLIQQSYIEEVMHDSILGLSDMMQPNVQILSQYLTDALFLLFPGFFTAILTAAGLSIGSQMSNLADKPGSDAGSPARQAGNKASGAVQSKVASTGKAALSKGMKK
jgi:hypothetical protein